MLTKVRSLDWALVLVMAFVFCIAIAALQFLNGIGDAERGRILFEKSCPLNVRALQRSGSGHFHAAAEPMGKCRETSGCAASEWRGENGAA
jgi:hypothetical protein